MFLCQAEISRSESLSVRRYKYLPAAKLTTCSRAEIITITAEDNMWFSWTVLLLAALACLADVAHTEEVSRLASLRSRRMVGGSLAPHVPWQAMVFLSDNILDGGYASGALISDRWVLTAGRNLFVRKTRQDTQGKQPVIPKVYLGITGRVQANASKEVAVEKVVLHPAFQNQTDWDNDLALIKLRKPVVMSDKVAPIPLPERGQDPADGAIAGWGWGLLLTPSSSLKHLILSLASHSNCKAEYAGSNLQPAVDDNMFCTRAAEFEHNVCFGDAGGALAVRDPATGDVYAAGILSYDKACSRYPYAVYMKISNYLPWIHSVTRGDAENSSAVRSAAISKMISWLS